VNRAAVTVRSRSVLALVAYPKHWPRRPLLERRRDRIPRPLPALRSYRPTASGRYRLYEPLPAGGSVSGITGGGVQRVRRKIHDVVPHEIWNGPPETEWSLNSRELTV
jgi:hypothetical protein